MFSLVSDNISCQKTHAFKFVHTPAFAVRCLITLVKGCRLQLLSTFVMAD